MLLRAANDLCDLPVATFRSDMILAHSRFTGQLNVPDLFSRLLLTLITTGIAPRSFYETDPDGNRQAAHFDVIALPDDDDVVAVAGERRDGAMGDVDERAGSFDDRQPQGARPRESALGGAVGRHHHGGGFHVSWFLH